MKFQVNLNEINYGLNMVTRAIAVRPVKQTYECVLLESNDKGLLLTCTDGEMTIKTQIESTISEEGQTLLPARLFSDLMRRQSGGGAEVSIDARSRASIKAGGSKASLVGMPADDFPVISDITAGNEIVLPCGKLKEAISHVMFAVSTDDSRKVLTGVLMEFEREGVRLVGLDGFRLALQQIKAGNVLPEGKERLSAIIPGRVMNELSKMLPDEDDDKVTLRFSQTHIMISFDNVRVYTSLLTGEFIDYRNVLPRDHSITVKTGKAAFMESLERCSLMAKEGKNNLITLDIRENEILMTSRAERGDIHEEIIVETNGSPLKISFNAQYLIDVIRNAEGEKILLGFNSNVSPCLVMPEEGDRFSFLVLPVRTFD